MQRWSRTPGEFWRDPPWWFRDFILALAVGSLLLLTQWRLDNRAQDQAEQRATLAADRAQRLENLSFVRDHSSKAQIDRPFARIDLRGQDLEALQLEHSNFTGAKLDGANFQQANLTHAYFNAAHLHGASFDHAALHWAVLTNTDSTKAIFRASDLTNAVFTDTNLTGADLDRAKLEYVDFSGADLSDADLRQVTLGGTYFGGVCYNSGTKWPDGFDPPASTASSCH